VISVVPAVEWECLCLACGRFWIPVSLFPDGSLCWSSGFGWRGGRARAVALARGQAQASRRGFWWRGDCGVMAARCGVGLDRVRRWGVEFGADVGWRVAFGGGVSWVNGFV